MPAERTAGDVLRFFDANGRELHVGSRVERQRVFSDSPSGPETVRQFRWAMECGGWSVVVGMIGLPVRALGDPNTWICPDLTLAPEQDGEDFQ